MTDVSVFPEKAKEMNMYSLILIVFNGTYRWNGPITLKKIEQISQTGYAERLPYIVETGKEVCRGKISYLTEENVCDVCSCCSPKCEREYCRNKGQWITNIRKTYKLPHLGILSYDRNVCAGGAEFVPSEEVPYNVPKNNYTAFLTCSYLSDENYDYKSYPLMILEKELKNIGYKKIEAVVSEKAVFPNGFLTGL